MAKTLEQLLSLSSIIANETRAGANTALRVGGLFSDIIYYLRDLDYADKDDIPSLEGYATEQWVLSQGFLTQHQDLSDYAKLTDIPTTDINKGVTAYGWGDHSKVGYLTGITSKLVTDALGYTPYDSANFTKANIKSTLGISDWALASSKPSYTTKEVSEDTNLYFTNARAVAALKSITDGLQSDIDTKLDASVFSELFEKVTLEGGVTAIRAKYGLFTDYFLSAKGANTNGGSSSGGGLITSLYRYSDLGKTFADTSNDTFNAYTINKINSDLGSRISVLEGKATNVSFTQLLTSGTQIGTITIDGASKNIYAPTIPTSDINKGVTAYGWGNHASVGYAMASALGGYQTKITNSNKLDYSLISGVPTKLSQFTNDLGLGTFAYKSSLAFADLTNKPTTIGGFGITDAYTKTQVDSALGGYLLLSGGVMTGRLHLKGVLLSFQNTDGSFNGYLTSSNYNLLWYKDDAWHTIIHSGNIGSQSVASAAKLTTAQSIWGQSFDGTGNIVGVLTSNTTKDKYRVTNNVYYQATEMYASNLSVGDQIGINVGQSYAAKKMAYLGYYQGADDATTRLTLGLHSVDNIIIANALGNVGIGEASPITPLHITKSLTTNGDMITLSSKSNWCGIVYKAVNGVAWSVCCNVSNQFYFWNDKLMNNAAHITSDGVFWAKAGIWSDGYVSAKGQNTSSDMRLKNVLNEVVLGVKDIANAPSVRFSWKNGGGVDVGSSAQYWQRLLPDAVKERDGMLEMQYANIALLSAIALAKNFETVEQRVARLERENEELRTKIDMMERGIA